jgi:hypothetical protein
LNHLKGLNLAKAKSLSNPLGYGALGDGLA